MVNSRISMVARVVMLLAMTLLFVPLPGDSVRDEETIQPLVGDPDVVQAAYERWKKAYASRGGDATLRLELGHSRGLSAEVSAARGHAVLDLRSGALAVEVRDLSAGEFDVWLIGNRSGQSRSVKPRSGDAMVRVGRLTPGDRAATLAAELPRSLAGAFTLDLIAVSHAAGDPTTRGVLFGAPNLFQRLYYQERQGRPASAAVAAPFGLLVPRPAFAANGSPVPLAQLVAQGERIFFEQTFEGNGRTCGTCHPATNNFTIDRAFIETLPLDDPLFVAEFTPALLTDFEKPELMRASGLILENVDGFEDLPNKFTMRGVPHTLGMAVSLTAFPPGQAPLEATGWSGDGAPGSGTLREFAIGAVIQHFTKSLNRVEGVDFRLPTGSWTPWKRSSARSDARRSWTWRR